MAFQHHSLLQMVWNQCKTSAHTRVQPFLIYGCRLPALLLNAHKSFKSIHRSVSIRRTRARACDAITMKSFCGKRRTHAHASVDRSNPAQPTARESTAMCAGAREMRAQSVVPTWQKSNNARGWKRERWHLQTQIPHHKRDPLYKNRIVTVSIFTGWENSLWVYTISKIIIAIKSYK